MDLQTRRSTSMEHGIYRSKDVEAQMTQVLAILSKDTLFNAASLQAEVEWFYGPLGLHEFYFLGHSPEVIASHIKSLLAAKILTKTSGQDQEFKLVQENAKSAFFATRSNVQGDETRTTRTMNSNEVANLERFIEKEYLNSSTECIGDGVKTGYQHLEQTEAAKIRQYRLQCYRSAGVLDAKLVPSHMRLYFLQEPDFVVPNPVEGETDINKIADKSFLERSGPNLKKVYQEVLKTAASQMTPAFHTEVWLEPDNTKMARLTVCFKAGSTHSYFSSLADVYRGHGLFSSRKYAEYFSNGYVVYGFYLQQLECNAKGSGTFEERVAACLSDASLHYVLPRTSLSPMLRDHLLTPQQISYAYAAWKFTFHFLQRLPEAYSVVSDSLRDRDSVAFARLEQLRSAMKQNTFTEAQILDHILASPALVKTLYEEFEALHSPSSKNRNRTRADTLSALRKAVSSEQALTVFSQFVAFNHHVQHTNFFRKQKSALAFRLDGEFLPSTEYREKPFAVIFVIGSEFRGFHTRFLDIARGGIRMIRSSHAQVYLNNVSSCFDEGYGLASTQQRKNKDIPEGGSKGVVLLNLAHQDKADLAFKKYIDALLDIMLPENDGIVRAQEDILFLGPDEGTAHLMDWASSYAKSRGYSYWKAITTGKSPSRGGIPHDEYGMTTHSVRQFVTGIQAKLNLKAPGAKRLTKVQTGGPDGDLGSNEILMSEGEDTIAVVDGSGVLYDPNGINRAELVRLAKARSPVEGFNKALLSKDGYLVLISQNDFKLPSGEVVENGTQFRNNFHNRSDVTADFFVPCGGRPAAVNLSNVTNFMYQADGKTLRFKYIVEGANLFFTQDARLVLEKAGVVLFKDASANKGGVTSSSLEVMAALSMTDAEFGEHMAVQAGKPKPAFYQAYVAEVQTRIDNNATKEFECLWREHQRTPTPYAILTNLLSERITDLSVTIQDSSLYEQKALRDVILKDGFPKTLQAKIAYDELLKRLPESYLRALFASQLASRFVYSCGLNCPEFAFYEFVQTLNH
ncbi:hypothetical protein SDRG_05763 [Saprolegnia diclina VS20]|uniref:Glutamate/phenylalanine/leucine/valine/L-tryptophan dehydrogenase C-terminal domain-containing protein n=1 Tax=Saprolegnia diclina (strain VS20) TaxID=1156394 RepID=T0RWQ0_SAPDV|nr:hypothetical protein SDRG_05763 [Saprolegnia diclina VS20]EQC36938.1 hypothetical protein SDRG_05763 [Saprolegnia diclina VS20]|eukprot:XP_008609719.1 hypothetical protein SDRG_05763 [Saprolegnia diclina VS20]